MPEPFHFEAGNMVVMRVIVVATIVVARLKVKVIIGAKSDVRMLNRF
jgi:hypothetical protein